MVRGPVAGALACRNRLRACVAAGVAPAWRDYEGDDPVAFVLSLNLERRHLNESQRAMVAARVATLPKGVRADTPIGGSAATQTQAATQLNVGERTVQRAREVLTKAAPEVVQAVERGKLAVSAAAIARWLSFRTRPKRPVCRLSDTRRASVRHSGHAVCQPSPSVGPCRAFVAPCRWRVAFPVDSV
jgi:hypothetical protein